MQTEQVVYIFIFGGHQESYTWQRPHKRFGGRANSSALSSDQCHTRTHISLILPVPVLAKSFSAVQRIAPPAPSLHPLISFSPWAPHLIHGRGCFLYPLLPCWLTDPKYPTFMPFVTLFFSSSSNSFKVLATPQPSSFQPIADLLGSELPHYRQPLGHL